MVSPGSRRASLPVDGQLISIQVNAGIVVIDIVLAALSAYVAFRLITMADATATGRSTARGKYATRLLAASFLALGTWACQIINGRISGFNVMPSLESPLLQFNPGFVLLSLFIPSLLVCFSFLILGSQRATPWCRCLLSGFLIGFAVDAMHYTLFLALPLNIHYDTLQLVVSLFLCIFASFLSSFSIVFLRSKWSNCLCIRILVPFVYGAVISGANALALEGTSVSLRSDFDYSQLGGSGRRWSIITLVVPSIIAAILCCAAAYIALKDYAAYKLSFPRPLSPRLTIASIAFTSDGRVLVDDHGLLPTQVVDLDGLDKDIIYELKTDRDTFHWLYSLSFDWSILSPFLGSLTKKVKFRDVETALRAAFDSSYYSASRPTSDPRSTLKLRLLEAAARLAGDLDIPLSKLGHLYDRTLTTGSHLNFADFLNLSAHEASRKADPEKSSQMPDHTGLMLFFVRDLPRRPLPEEDWLAKYAVRGYRLQYMRRFRDAFSEAASASQRGVDKILLGCRDYMRGGVKPVLEPQATYVCLYAERKDGNGCKEVLVHDSAKHQVPFCRLDVRTFTPEMRAWIHGVSRTSAADLLQLCDEGVVADPTCDDQPGDPSLSEFKKALVSSLDHLLLEMSFVEKLSQRAILSPLVVDAPSSDGGAPAHLIMLKVELWSAAAEEAPSGGFARLHPDHEEIIIASNPSRSASECHSSLSSCKTNTPATYTYTPKSLYEVAQSLMHGTIHRFRQTATVELRRLLPLPATANARGNTPLQTPLALRGGVELVSTFSLDSVSDAELAPPKMTVLAGIKERVCKCLPGVARRLYYGRRDARWYGGHLDRPPSLMGKDSLAYQHNTLGIPSIPSNIPTPSECISEDKLPTHPYLQPRVPSPVVLTSYRLNHRRSSSVISFVATDETFTDTCT